MAKSRHPSLLFTSLVLIGVYPLITVLSYVIESLAGHWPLWRRTALLTPLMMFAMLYGLIPAIQRTLRHLPVADGTQPSERPQK
ncbi:MAG: hypothetical protein AAFU66_04920 [Pseudomonadota bacterium]